MVHAPAENVYTQLSPVAFNVPPSRTWRILRKQFNYYQSEGIRTAAFKAQAQDALWIFTTPSAYGVCAAPSKL